MPLSPTADMTKIRCWPRCKPRLATFPRYGSHHSTNGRQRPYRTLSITASQPLTNKTSELSQLTLYFRRPCHIHPKLASPHTSRKTATPLIPPSLAIPTRQKNTRLLVTTLDPSNSFSPSSLSTDEVFAEQPLHRGGLCRTASLTIKSPPKLHYGIQRRRQEVLLPTVSSPTLLL